jgi:hypothetical protein
MMAQNQPAGLRMSKPSEPPRAHRPWLARAYPAPWRWLAGGLVGVSRASLPAFAALLLARLYEPFELPTLLAMLAAWAALPGAAAWLIERAFTARAELRDGALHLRGRGLHLEVPLAGVARVLPWRVPLPGVGLGLRLRSGSLLRAGLEAPDLTPLLGALEEERIAGAREAQSHPWFVYAAARARRPRGILSHPLVKFPGFALLPTAVMFNAHQHIAYGGSLGQYYQEGLTAWLRTFAEYWIWVCIYLVLYASLCRAAAEGVALLAASAGSELAARVRRTVERVCGILYYAGVPALVAARFLL